LLLKRLRLDSRAVFKSALELFRGRYYSDVVALCRSGLQKHADDVALRLLLARALIALRRDIEARQELRHAIAAQPDCAEAYRLLGDLALLCDELDAAAAFFRAAARFDPGDARTAELLRFLKPRSQPTEAVEQLPAATAPVGPIFRRHGAAPKRGRRLAIGTEPAPTPPQAIRASRLGAYLVETGALSPGQLRTVLKHHRRSRQPVGRCATMLGYLSTAEVERAAARFLSAQRAARDSGS
jgi:tetratricopeptide (TPR) repeat protein